MIPTGEELVGMMSSTSFNFFNMKNQFCIICGQNVEKKQHTSYVYCTEHEGVLIITEI